MSTILSTVRPELVEGLLSFCEPLEGGEQCFDKLSTNGVGETA